MPFIEAFVIILTVVVSCILLHLWKKGMSSEGTFITISPSLSNRRCKKKAKRKKAKTGSGSGRSKSQNVSKRNVQCQQRRKARLADDDIQSFNEEKHESDCPGLSPSSQTNTNNENKMEIEDKAFKQMLPPKPDVVKVNEWNDSKRRKGNELEDEDKPSSSKLVESPKDFSHPIYRQMSLQNGHINRMSKTQLQTALKDLQCSPLGSGDVLKRRLKYYNSKKMFESAGMPTEVPLRYDYLCVIDVEATCLEFNPPEFLHEIIEFPIVLVNTRTLQIEDTFESFCKPIVNSKLSKFCSQLTHISQKMVDSAEEFPAVLKRVESWMEARCLGTEHSFAVATDCSLDMDLYLKSQCILSRIPYPQFAKEWINVSKVFANLYKTKRVPLRAMLQSIGLEFSGQPHRGIDDAKNIARIALQLIKDGAELKCNEKLTPT